MNTDKMKGAAKDAEGKLQRKLGEATGDTKQQVKGLAKQGEGKLQKGLGEARDALDDADDADRADERSTRDSDADRSQR